MNQKNLWTGTSILVLSLIYAIVRYHLFKGLEWVHFPLYTLNKVLSFGGLTMLVAAVFFRLRTNSKPDDRSDTLMFSGIVCVLLHVAISLILISPNVYEGLYRSEGMFNWLGQLSMFFGVLGLLFMVLFRILPVLLNDETRHRSLEKIMKSLPPGFLFFGLHVFFLGFKGWFTPVEWPGGMPPISLLSFLMAAAGLIVALKLRRYAFENPDQKP
jgi:hypothetical protein